MNLSKILEDVNEDKAAMEVEGEVERRSSTFLEMM